MNFIKQFKKVKDKTIRKQLIENYDTEFVKKYGTFFDPDVPQNKISECIANGFNWMCSPQGFDYWKDIYIKTSTQTLELRKGKKY